MEVRGLVALMADVLLCVYTSASGWIVWTHNYIGYSYYGVELGYAIAKGGMPTNVVGNPYSTEIASFNRAITDAIYRKNQISLSGFRMK